MSAPPIPGFLGAREYSRVPGAHVMFRRGGRLPDLFIAPEDLEPYADEDGIGIGVGVDAAAVRLVVEAVPPGRRSEVPDRVRKRREYARAGTRPRDHRRLRRRGLRHRAHRTPARHGGGWSGVVQVPYGTDAEVPKGPAKGFLIGEAITGPKPV